MAPGRAKYRSPTIDISGNSNKEEIIEIIEKLKDYKIIGKYEMRVLIKVL